MRYILIILAAMVMLTQQAVPAPEKEIIHVSRTPAPITYETAWQMGLAHAPMFFNIGQTMSGDPVLLYYNNLVFREDSGPSTPLAGQWALYAKSDGMYYKDDAGVETGPLAAAGSGSGDVTSSSNITDHALVRGDGGTKGIQDADQWIIGDNGDMVGTLAGATNHAMSTKVTADAAERWVVRADGAQLFSDGTGAPDTAFQRSQANTFALGTGDAFRLVGSAGDHAGPLDGMIHYDTTSNRFDFRENGAWQSYIKGSGTDHTIARFDGTDTVQDSGFSIDDSDVMTCADGGVDIDRNSASPVLQGTNSGGGAGVVGISSGNAGVGGQTLSSSNTAYGGDFNTTSLGDYADLNNNASIIAPDSGRARLHASGSGQPAWAQSTGMYRLLQGLVYQAQAASSAITNTTSETSFSIGSFTFPADSLTDGMCIKGRCYVRAATTASPNLTIRVDLDGVTVATLLFASLNLVSATDGYIEYEITVITTGATGTVWGSASGAFNRTLPVVGGSGTAAVGSVDTTGTCLLEVTAQWSAMSASNTITMYPPTTITVSN